MTVLEFFLKHPVFTLDEFRDFLKKEGLSSHKRPDLLLKYYEKENRLLRIRRGIYAYVPVGFSADNFSPDVYLVASKAAADSVLAYHTALELHGFNYSVFYRLTFYTQYAVRKFVFRDHAFYGVRPPKAILDSEANDTGIGIIERSGIDIKATNLERTVVDVLNRPNYSGGWEEVWRSLETIPYLDFKKIVHYTLLYKNATLAAKVGFFLKEHSERLMVDDTTLEKLQKHRPNRKHYMDRSNREGGKFLKEWNLVVPKYVLEKSWEEPQ